MEESKKKQGERNPGASIQQRLRNHAQATGEDTVLILARYIIERFLYRLSQSPYQERFVLRGATLFSVWTASLHRPTRDVDLLATGESSAEAMAPLFQDICATVVPEDGVLFLPETLRIEERSEGRVYQGLHVEVTAALGSARPRLEIDVAFGEVITPGPQEVEVPTLLSQPRPRLRAYPRETVLAEKTEALVSLGINNTRLKDFFDLWYISATFPVDGRLLTQALSATFTRRQTAFPEAGLPMALTDRFYKDETKQSQWKKFRGKVEGSPEGTELEALIRALQAFLVPPLEALALGKPFSYSWRPGDGWLTVIDTDI